MPTTSVKPKSNVSLKRKVAAKKPTLAAALAVDAEINARHEARRNPTSLISRVAELALGDSLSECEPVPEGTTVDYFAKYGALMRDKMRNRIQSSVTSAWKRLDCATVYKIEVATLITTGNNLYLIAIVTRIQ